MGASFLRLPSELRFKTYIHVFANTVITIHALKDPDVPVDYDWATADKKLLRTQLEHEFERSCIGRSKVALLSVNHQIRDESVPIFFPNVILNLHVGAVSYMKSESREKVTKMFSQMFSGLPVIAQIQRMAFNFESASLFTPYLKQFVSLREVYVWDWKSLCVSEAEYFSEVGCGSTRHEEYNERMAESLYDKLSLGHMYWKTYFQHAVCDTTDDLLELGSKRGSFQHQVIPCARAVISRDDMDVDNLAAYPLR